MTPADILETPDARRAPCDTCGSCPPHGGERRYIDSDGNERRGCVDGLACKAAWVAAREAEATMTETPDPPADVLAWWHETYTDDGVALLLTRWFSADDAARAFMCCHARIDPMGS